MRRHRTGPPGICSALKLEKELDAQGIPLFATDEPAQIEGINATSVLIRRIKQGIAEWYRIQLKDKARPMPPGQWIWSAHPTHDALVDKATWDAAQRAGADHGTSRDTETPTTRPGRRYQLRSRLWCKICRRRMRGATRTGPAYRGPYVYYRCPHDKSIPRHAAAHPGHPSVTVREDELMTALTGFFSERVFGPDRRHARRHPPGQRRRPGHPASTRPPRSVSSSPGSTPQKTPSSPNWRHPPGPATRPPRPSATGSAPASPSSTPSGPGSKPSSPPWTRPPPRTTTPRC
jgi:hypothetical protein